MFDKMGWAYFVDIDDTHSAMGSYRKNDDVFYWMVYPRRRDEISKELARRLKREPEILKLSPTSRSLL